MAPTGNNRKAYDNIIAQHGSVDNYYKSSAFTGLAPASQTQIRNTLGAIAQSINGAQANPPAAPAATPQAAPNGEFNPNDMGGGSLFDDQIRAQKAEGIIQTPEQAAA